MRDSSYPPFVTELLASIASVSSESLADGAHLGRMLSELAQREIAEGGPYALEPLDETPDLGLNIAIALFLSAYDVRLPNLDAFIEARMADAEPTPGILGSRVTDGLYARYAAELAAAAQGAPAPDVSAAREADVMQAFTRALADRLASVPPTFAENAQWAIERTIRGNQDKQMSLMPLFVADALGSLGESFTDDELGEFALANAFFWTAFIIYDDFWDEDEAAEPKLLPVANLLARHYVRFFDTVLPQETRFDEFFHALMDSLDAANEWEMLSCRLEREGNLVRIPVSLPAYEDFGIKFYPAAGHVLGPVALFVKAGYAVDSQEVLNLVDYFRHYLIAMQLNDDAHDWKEDLSRGTVSTAVSLLLNAWREHYPESVEIDLAADLPELERLFWFEVLVPLCESVHVHARSSRRALESLACVTNPAPLEQFIIRNEAIADEGLAEYRRSVGFLAALAEPELSPEQTR